MTNFRISQPRRSSIPTKRHSRVFGGLFVVVFVLLSCPVPQLAWGFQNDEAMQAINPEIGPAPKIDRARVEASGIDVFEGQHVTLYTDLRDDPRSRELVRVFDAAVPQWCQILQVKPERTKGWKMRAFLIASSSDLSRFQKAGLVDQVPQFAAGFQRDHSLWMFGQPGKYYTPHLLLHEGTHAFMQWFTGGYGAPWYSEGMAELTGLHRWKKGQLQLNYRLKRREEADYWGRIKLLREDRDAGKAMTLEEMMLIPATAFRDVRYYAWSWAGCNFFSRHPRTAATFKTLVASTQLNATEFNRLFRQRLDDQGVAWNRLSDDWTLYLNEADYGSSIERSTLADATALDQGQIQIASDRSWQVTPIEVNAGDRFLITAKGRLALGEMVTQVVQDGTSTAKRFPIHAEANGVTLAYYRGKPLGQLHAGVLQLDQANAIARTAQLVTPEPIGNRREIQFKTSGILCFRINESSAHLADNQGSLVITVKKLE